MDTLSSWEAQTVELIRIIENEIEEKEAGLAAAKEAKESLEQSLRIYRARIGSQYTESVQSIKPREFKDKSIRDILNLIAERNNKTLVVKNAIKLMKEADVFGNPLNADSVVYSILSRSPEFKKVGRGVYRLNGENGENKKGVRKERIPGLKKAMQELKSKNPDMTKWDVRDTLIKRGFDFRGKNPSKVVHILWVNLGYAKKDKEAQQNIFQ